eukprot:TRINITY_DN13432_c0_g1_i1.p1 TRINITY_DN13432_c0_g1~~TRINITY_DN13432_c0_g1_i1.p1  ORF type:complete len:232 (-),score=37.70 TRINITY_DN13432_c0_g1_i1:171-866(-)
MEDKDRVKFLTALAIIKHRRRSNPQESVCEVQEESRANSEKLESEIIGLKNELDKWKQKANTLSTELKHVQEEALFLSSDSNLAQTFRLPVENNSSENSVEWNVHLAVKMLEKITCTNKTNETTELWKKDSFDLEQVQNCVSVCVDFISQTIRKSAPPFENFFYSCLSVLLNTMLDSHSTIRDIVSKQFLLLIPTILEKMFEVTATKGLTVFHFHFLFYKTGSLKKRYPFC